MPSPDKHKSQTCRKLLLLGDAKVGKTTSLASLVAAGFKVRILDMDNLLDTFVAVVRRDSPDKMKNVDVRTIRDKRAMTEAGPSIIGQPKAFIEAIKMIDKWKYESDGEKIDLGVPGTWGPDSILVIDSLSRLCDAAYDWREAIAPRSARSGEYDRRSVYKDAQDAIENLLATITSESFNTNIIVIAHGVYMDQGDGATKIFPQGVGQKLSPKIPEYFPAYVRYDNTGGKRTIHLKSTALINLANPDPFVLPDSLPADTGLAAIFGRPLVETKPTPKAQTLKRA
jgi:hypothetical protein